MNTFILLFILTLCWGFQPFFKKKPLEKLTSLEFYCIEYLFYFIPILFYFLYLYHTTKFNCISKLDKNDIIYFLLVVFTGTIGGITFANLLKQNNASYVIPSVQPLIIVCTLIFGYFIFNESLDMYQIMGSILVICGLLCINYKKITNK